MMIKLRDRTERTMVSQMVSACSRRRGDRRSFGNGVNVDGLTEVERRGNGFAEALLVASDVRLRVDNAGSDVASLIVDNGGFPGLGIDVLVDPFVVELRPFHMDDVKFPSSAEVLYAVIDGTKLAIILHGPCHWCNSLVARPLSCVLLPSSSAGILVVISVVPNRLSETAVKCEWNCSVVLRGLDSSLIVAAPARGYDSASHRVVGDILLDLLRSRGHRNQEPHLEERRGRGRRLAERGCT